MVKAVLFDFAGTLFHGGNNLDGKLDGITDADGKPLDAKGSERLARRMASAHADTDAFDDEHRHAWEQRDLDAAMHRKAFVHALQRAGVPEPAHAERLYDYLIDIAAWQPYPDALEVLAELSTRGIPVAVVSNTAFDIRAAFTACELDPHVKEYVLSYEHGVIKPDPGIFRLGLEAVGATAGEALMVGDNPHADGGATELGIRFAQVDAGHPADRPTALRDALAAHGVW